MESGKRRVGASISPEEFEALSDRELLRLVPKAYRDDFPGKEGCVNGYFYLLDGTAWSFFKGSLLDD